MDAFGFSVEYTLSTREARLRGDTDRGRRKAIADALTRYDLPYDIDDGGGAFYGPKLDIHVRDAIGRKWQLARCKWTSSCRSVSICATAEATAKTTRPS